MKKNRWSDFQVDLLRDSSIVNLSPAEVPLILVFSIEGERPQKINLSFLGDHPILSQLFAKVFWIEGPKYSRKTRALQAESLSIFHHFLNWKAESENNITTTAEIDYTTLQQFSTWLISIRKLKVTTAANRYSLVTTFLQAARALYPDKFSDKFSVPENVFPGSKHSSRQVNILSLDALRTILRIAAEDADDIQKRFREGDVPRNLRPLIPFMILIAAKTAINPISLYEMKRDCLEPHVIDTNAFHVVWTKRRSRTGIQKQLHYLTPKGNGVIELIRFVKAYTDPLANEANVIESKRLFLYLLLKNCNSSPGVKTITASGVVSFHLKEFIAQHNLPNFQMCQIRPTVATHHYMQNGGNLRKVQVLLGHKSISTTEDYISREYVQPLHNKTIRSAQAEMLNRITVIPKRTNEALAELAGSLPTGNLQKIADGSYDTGWGKCVNPFKSPQPNQQEGKCCTLFFACPTCPNALFFLEDLPRVIAIRNYFLALKKTLKTVIWKTLYEEKIFVIEQDIIGAFTNEQIADAEQKATRNMDVRILIGEGMLK